ncbi:uncharacterized protein LOC143040061 isoform X2 [Oratosquilla oratoria]|uniref:uncharacterized protein LOC143040061 isoform X2 n=1 Tax=Oratosquilla oratoria TaxID=337810 RepID=UPI003F75AD0F
MIRTTEPLLKGHLIRTNEQLATTRQPGRNQIKPIGNAMPIQLQQMALLKEIDYDNLPSLKDTLRSHLPRSIMVHGIVDVTLRYQSQELETKFFYANETSCFNSFVVATPVCSWEGVQTLSVYFEDKGQVSSEVPDNEALADEEMAQLLMSIPDLDWTKPVYYFACTLNVLSRVRRLMASRRIGVGHRRRNVAITHVYIFDPKEAPRKLGLADGYTLGCLSSAHADWVYDHWFYNFTETRPAMSSYVSNFPTMAAFVTKPEEVRDLPEESSQPVSWILTYKTGSLGNTFTLVDHRRKGLAKEVTLALAKKVDALGSPVFVNVAEGNTASRDFHVNLGFKKSIPIMWEIFLPPGVSFEMLTSSANRSRENGEEANVKKR